LLPTNNAPPPTVMVSGDVNTQNSGGVDIQCFLGDICEVALTIVTLGLVDFTPEISINTEQEFQNQVALNKPDPIELNQVKVDESQVSNSGGTLSGEVASVKISPQGLVATLNGKFSADSVDPDITVTPGALLTGRPTPPGGPASPPTAPVSGAQDIFLAMADDTLAMMFASMTLSGKLKTHCADSDVTIGDLLPTDCESASFKVGDLTTNEGKAATALVRGLCHALRENSCEAITQTIVGAGETGANLLTAIEQGTCHGAKGDICDQIQTQVGFAIVEKEACQAIPKLPVKQTDELLLCTRQDVPPRPLLLSGGSNGVVPAALRMNDLSVALVLGRGTEPETITDIGTLPPCFGTGSQATGACRAYAMCLDLDFKMDMEFQTCTDGKPGIVSTAKDLEILDRQKGVICGGSSPAADDVVASGSTSGASNINVDLKGEFQKASPPFCAKGFDLGGTLNCNNPKLFTMKTDGAETFKDYLGITCPVTP
jgi:hypothetical protein